MAPEYSVGKRRVDFALLTKGTPAVFVEVKQPGLVDKADRQLFEYAFHEGVPIAILTDGATWHVYLPAMQGSYDERRVYLLDLLERDTEECAERLTRYLARDAVEAGKAFDRARQDYTRAKQRKGAAEAIPQAWVNLLSDPAEGLLLTLASEVERASGFEADLRDLRTFLSSLKPGSGVLPDSKPTTQPRPPKEPNGPSGDLPGVGYEIEGTFVPCARGRDVIVGVFQEFAARDETFPNRFAKLIKGRKRAYLASSTAELYPGHPELEPQSQEIAPGWYVATHNSSAMKCRLIEKASGVAGLVYGSDVRVQMP